MPKGDEVIDYRLDHSHRHSRQSKRIELANERPGVLPGRIEVMGAGTVPMTRYLIEGR